MTRRPAHCSGRPFVVTRASRGGTGVMTRSAARKRRQHTIKQLHHHLQTTRAGVPWVTVGALVATSAVGLRPSLASAHELAFNQDVRLAVIDAALRSTNSVPARLAYQDQATPASTV